MIDAPMTAREQALKESHSELLKAAYSILDLLGPWESASPNPEMREAIAATRSAALKAERLS